MPQTNGGAEAVGDAARRPERRRRALNSTAPAVIGTLMRKATRTAASRSRPTTRPAVIVTPLRLTPGWRASAWPTPIEHRRRGSATSSTGRVPPAAVGPQQHEAEHDEHRGDERDLAEVLVDRRR